MNDNERDRVERLLKLAVPPVGEGAEAGRDLWPAVLRRMDETAGSAGWAWFDGALLAGLAVLGVAFPATIPVLLYYL